MSSEPDVISVAGSAFAADFRSLLSVPEPEVQRAIIAELESDGVEESIYVYTVSRDWYDRWRIYVGLLSTSIPEVETGTDITKPEVGGEMSNRRAVDTATSSVADSAKNSSSTQEPKPPGPIEMDLSAEDDNMSVDEKVCYYGGNRFYSSGIF